MAEVEDDERVKNLNTKIAELEATDDDADADDEGQIIMEDNDGNVDDADEAAVENGETTNSTSQEAVKSQKSRRSREFEELRKRAAAAANNNAKSEEEGTVELSAFERMKLKKQQELDELRARGGFNAANKSRFDTGQALTTDMLSFERNQKLAAEQERKKRWEASEGLKKTHVSGMSSWERNQLLGKDEARRRQLEAREGLHRYRLSLDPSRSIDESPEKKSVVAAVAATAAQHNQNENKSSDESNVDKVDEDIPEPKQGKLIKKEKEEPEPDVKTSSPKAKEDAAAADDAETPSPKAKEEDAADIKTSSPKAKEEDAIAAKPQRSVQKPPAYGRVDIKFSFGLVVKSGTKEESLRESETLRKCMNGTRDILTEELPAPPKPSDITAVSTVSFPQAYYDPILEPNVLSIQEDTSKKPAKGKNNTRTLVKASFPIFIREEATDDEGKKRAALSLKETKATIFKALRAAVSGGNFLK
eukprot:CAMPEP_0201726258 /NCGR_PEP_ID=MMETSP0593-20130828/9350_1 /ASSEMBLY_ACC=CAM_ASM_000672 /TAXON_ID=267983 /ORGANISM="Skeletonema japonicum, Strain CCMP2506" /LENGTH=475 /DNA_ID=CAMNT_0048217729 /DNA_START=30 /DNA_END=1457 /DNA_ORIENTATION=+